MIINGNEAEITLAVSLLNLSSRHHKTGEEASVSLLMWLRLMGIKPTITLSLFTCVC